MSHVEVIEEEAAIAAYLARDPIWSAYALTDLDVPYRQYAVFIGALEDGALISLLLIYQAPGLTSLLPYGDSGGLRQILAEYDALPRSTHLLARGDDLAAIRSRYEIDQCWEMERMAVGAPDLRPAPPVDLPVRCLTPADYPQIAPLYRRDPDDDPAVFDPSMLRDGIYYGAYDNERLVAVAGTHTISHHYAVATIGGVFTLPAYRGRGLATALTGAVAQTLVAGGLLLLALNVRAGNEPAIRVYRRLGFVPHMSFVEGHAILR